MIIGFLIDMLTNKYVIMMLAAAGAFLGVYFKGRSAGASSVKADEQEARDTLNNAVRDSEAKNQQTEKEKNDALQDVDSASDSESVTRMLDNEPRSPKDSSSK